MNIQSKSKGGKMNLDKYAVVPSTKAGEKYKKKWLGPRSTLLVGGGKSLARLQWDKMRTDGVAPASHEAVKKANEKEKARREKAAVARETKRLARKR